MPNREQKNNYLFHDKLNALHVNDNIPIISRQAGTLQIRWQAQAYSTAVFYNKEIIPEKMGRYADPTGMTGICYTSDYAVTAIAESYGRIYQRRPDDFLIGSDDLINAHICRLITQRQTVTIDMVKLQGMLRITANQTMGNNTYITQAITDWAANTPGLLYDGITYSSRHYGVGTCTAYWVRKEATDPLITLDMTTLANYIDKDTNNFPPKWKYPDIKATEILTEVFGYTLVPNIK